MFIQPVTIRAVLPLCALFFLILGWSCPLGAESHTNNRSADDDGRPVPAAVENHQPDPGLPFIDEAITFGILAEFIGYYADLADESDADSASLWDFYLSSLELDLEIIFNTWLKADMAAEIENIGKKNDLASASLSRAFLTVQHPDFPIYAIGGKQTQPFGVFEDRMISGTITEDLYEIDETGATIGAILDRYRMDVSLSLYEGQDIIANLEDFGTHEFSTGRHREDGIDSYIANLSLSPLDDALELAIFYSSEPGDGKRNESIGGALSLYFWDFIVDAEYITAVKREDGKNGAENLENAWFVALAMQPIAALELATRLEFFNDDHEGAQDEVIMRRYLAGLNYGVTDHATVSVEYRHARYEREHGSQAVDQRNEVQVQLSIAY